MSEALWQRDLPPDTILYNARIYTVDQRMPWAEAIAIYDGRIFAVGSTAAIRVLAAPTTHLIDLEGRLVLPGLCDAHIHLHDWSLNLARPPLASASSQAEMLTMIQAYAQERAANRWVICHGWNESWWGQEQFFTARDLDAVTRPGQPAIASRSDMHVAVANSAALAIAGITDETPNPPGGLIDRDTSGKVTGVLRELAMGLVQTHIPPPSHREIVDNIVNATARLHQLGITAIHDQRIKDVNDGAPMLAAFQHLAAANDLKLRVNCNIAAHQLDALETLGLRSGFGNDFLRLGHVKVFSDGSLGSRTAWMLEPFEPQTSSEAANSGVNVTPPEQMAIEFFRAQSLGFPISVHAIGDRANRVVLDIFEELAPQLRPPPIPHRIEHVQTIDRADLSRLARLNITASVQPLHLIDDRDLADRFLGPRAANTYAFRSLHESGARLAFGSDAPVADPNPFLGMHAALVRRKPGDSRSSWQPQETLSIDRIIFAYTLGAAQAAGWDQTTGSITPGKRADLIVLNQDIFQLAEDAQTVDLLANTQILSTLFNGEFVHRTTD